MKVTSHFTLLALLCSVLYASTALAQQSSYENMYSPPINPRTKKDFSWKDGVLYGGLQSKKPGLKVRLTQTLSEIIKKDLLSYGSAFLNYDMNLPELGTYKVKLFPFYTDFHWYNLRTDPFLIDIEEFSFNFTQMKKSKEDVVYFRIPMIKSWNVYFDYDFTYIFHQSGSMSLTFHDLDAVVAVKLKATEHGHLYPQIENVKINIANS